MRRWAPFKYVLTGQPQRTRIICLLDANASSRDVFCAFFHAQARLACPHLPHLPGLSIKGPLRCRTSAGCPFLSLLHPPLLPRAHVSSAHLHVAPVVRALGRPRGSQRALRHLRGRSPEEGLGLLRLPDGPERVALRAPAVSRTHSTPSSCSACVRNEDSGFASRHSLSKFPSDPLERFLSPGDAPESLRGGGWSAAAPEGAAELGRGSGQAPSKPSGSSAFTNPRPNAANFPKTSWSSSSNGFSDSETWKHLSEANFKMMVWPGFGVIGLRPLSCERSRHDDVPNPPLRPHSTHIRLRPLPTRNLYFYLTRSSSERCPTRTSAARPTRARSRRTRRTSPSPRPSPSSLSLPLLIPFFHVLFEKFSLLRLEAQRAPASPFGLLSLSGPPRPSGLDFSHDLKVIEHNFSSDPVLCPGLAL